MNKLTLVILFFFTSVLATAQIRIKGKVMEDSKESVIGASVMEKGTTNGTITDINGNFSLEVTSQKSVLVISYVGMTTENVAVGSQTTLNVILKSNSLELEEVVAVGYGKMKKSDMTGSVTSVKMKDTETTPMISVDQLIKGKAAGVYVNMSSAEPGGVSSVKIRGVNSLTAGSDPLYVVDGVAMDNVGGGADPFNKTQQSVNPLSYLNPQDIVNIEILKDASATAIYGSRGSNGVVLVTTKSGVAGNTKVNITSSTTVSQPRKKIQMLNAPDYARYRNEVLINDGKPIIYGLTESTLPENLTSVNWQDVILRTAASQNTRVSVSGGTKTSNYYLSGGYESNQGIVKNTYLNRGDIRFNFNTNLSERIKLNFNVSASQIASQMTQTTGSGTSMTYSAMRSMISKSPILTTSSIDDPELQAELNSPLAWINDYKDDNTETRVSALIGLSVKLSKIFDYELKASYNYKNGDRFRYYGRTLSDYAAGAAGYSNIDYVGWSIDNLLNFNYSFNSENKISGLFGVTYNSADTKTLSYMATGFADDLLGYEAIGSATNVTSPLDRSRVPNKLNSYLTRLNYTFKEKYLLTVTGRVDGSSKFSAGHKFGFFPSTAFAWRVYEEPFIKNIEYISNLKLRLGWGLTGNQAISAYQTQARYDDQYSYSYGSELVSGAASLKLANKDLTWEKSEQYNIGIDLGFWKERLSFVIDLYRKQNTDMLINRPLPLSSGFSSGIVNFGALENKGAEFSTNVVILSGKNFKWTVDGNISVYRNKIVKLGLPVSTTTGYVSFTGGTIHPIGDLNQPGTIFIEGMPAGLFWGYKTAGVYQNQQEIDKFTADVAAKNGTTENKTTWYFGRKPVPGEVIYVDKNGDGVISSADYDIIGDPNPAFIWGGSSNFNYKNWGLNLVFNGVQGKDVMNINLNTENRLDGSIYNIRKSAWDGRWTGEGTSNYFPIASSKTITSVVSDRLVEDASYFRLSSITLSYTAIFNKKSIIKDLKLFLTGNNLVTLTKYSGYDPEVDSFAGDPLRGSMDNNSYPSSMSIIFGFNINL